MEQVFGHLQRYLEQITELAFMLEDVAAAGGGCYCC